MDLIQYVKKIKVEGYTLAKNEVEISSIPVKKRIIMQKGNIPKEVQLYEVTFKRYSTKSYDQIVESLVSEKYSVKKEIAFIRQQEEKPGEYAEYYRFVEECKKRAKEFINERDEIL